MKDTEAIQVPKDRDRASTAQVLKDLLTESAGRPLRAVVGFDGYEDSLFKVIRQRSNDGKVPYRDIKEFGTDILSRAGISGGFELEKISLRAGGNGPLMAAALAALGIKVTCIGALGLPEVEAVFQPLKERCRLLSVAEPASTVALEFGDGKIMLGDTGSFETLDWAQVVDKVGLQELRGLFDNIELLALVNWANLPKATDLWQGLLEDVLMKGSPRRESLRIFFDLADLTRCGTKETRELMELIGRFRNHGEVSLGLNENEAWQLADKLGVNRANLDSLESLGKSLLAFVKVDCLVIHPRNCAVVFQGACISTVPGRVVTQVLLSTGGGDNFNAGFCAGLLCGLSGKNAAELAVLVSSLYVETGRSPGADEILKIFV